MKEWIQDEIKHAEYKVRTLHRELKFWQGRLEMSECVVQQLELEEEEAKEK